MDRQWKLLTKASLGRNARKRVAMRADKSFVPIISRGSYILIEIQKTIAFQCAKNAAVELFQLRDVVGRLMKEHDVVCIARQHRLIEVGYEIRDCVAAAF